MYESIPNELRTMEAGSKRIEPYKRGLLHRAAKAIEERSRVADAIMPKKYIERQAAINAATKDMGPYRTHDFNAGCAILLPELYVMERPWRLSVFALMAPRTPAVFSIRRRRG